MLIDIQIGLPPYKITQEKATLELKKRMAVTPAVGRLIDMASSQSAISSRYLVIPDGDDQSNDKFYSSDGEYVTPGTEERMKYYEKYSKILAFNAIEKIFQNNNIKPTQIDKLITVSCTGFYAPGLDYYIAEHFEIPFSVKRINIGFMGCAASLVGLNNVIETFNDCKEEKNVLMIALEICTIHLQTNPSRDNILANMIFADGCAAALFSNRLVSRIIPLCQFSSMFKNSSSFMGWKVGNNGFEMILSSELPKIILDEAAPVLKSTLEKINLKISDIKHWALHPGGRAILDALQKGLELNEEQMTPSRTVLKNFGNMSSASILYVLKELMESGKILKDEYICAVAFGPGLSMEIAIFKGA